MNSKKTKKQLKRGFTVLELLIVITIIGILFSIFIFSYKDYKERARLAKTMEWAHSIKSYLGAYAAGIWTLGIIQVNVTPDYSGQESDCTVYGATLSKGVSENGLIFDGADYVNCGDKEIFKLPKGEKITLELWFNSSVSQSAALIAKRKSGSTDLYGMFLYQRCCLITILAEK